MNTNTVIFLWYLLAICQWHASIIGTLERKLFHRGSLAICFKYGFVLLSTGEPFSLPNMKKIRSHVKRTHFIYRPSQILYTGIFEGKRLETMIYKSFMAYLTILLWFWNTNMWQDGLDYCFLSKWSTQRVATLSKIKVDTLFQPYISSTKLPLTRSPCHIERGGTRIFFWKNSRRMYQCTKSPSLYCV